MHVAIVGAGALGSVYGALLATRGDCTVSMVARRSAPPSALRVERVGRDALVWMRPALVDAVPATSEVILGCLRYEQLDSLAQVPGPSGAPLVVMTPMLYGDRARLRAVLGARVLVGMPGVVAYRSEAGSVRYWLPRFATTFIEASPTPGPAHLLSERLNAAGVASKLDADVMGRNVATTLGFLPLATALSFGGGVDAVLANAPLVALALEAAEEGRALGRMLGTPAPWAAVATPFLRKWTLAAGVALAKAKASEALLYADAHFGPKLRAQNLAMSEEMVSLAVEKQADRAALTRLLDWAHEVQADGRTGR